MTHAMLLKGVDERKDERFTSLSSLNNALHVCIIRYEVLMDLGALPLTAVTRNAFEEALAAFPTAVSRDTCLKAGPVRWGDAGPQTGHSPTVLLYCNEVLCCAFTPPGLGVAAVRPG